MLDGAASAAPPSAGRTLAGRRGSARQRADSVRAAILARRSADSVKAPLARAEIPPLAAIGERFRWTREQLFSSGSLTLGELLGRVPGVTDFASGWIATPHLDAYLGDDWRPESTPEEAAAAARAEAHAAETLTPERG